MSNKRLEVGRIEDINDNGIKIRIYHLGNEENQFVEKVDINTAMNSYTIHSKDYIDVINYTHKLSKDMVIDYDENKNKEKVKNTLEIIINSYEDGANFERIKERLTHNILNAWEWAAWSLEAKGILDINPEFEEVKGRKGFYKVRKPITQEEKEGKLIRKFKSTCDFYVRCSIFQAYSNCAFEINDFYTEMLEYFFSIYKNSKDMEEIICSWLLLETTEKKVEESFSDVFSQIQDVAATFNAIPVQQIRLRRAFLKKIKDFIPNWAEIYCELFPCCLDHNILDKLLEDEYYIGQVKKMFKFILDNPLIYKWPFVWVCEHADNYPDILDIMPGYETILNNMFLLMDFTNRQNDNSTLNKLFSKYIEQYLFEPQNSAICRLAQYIQNVDKDKAIQMIKRLELTKGLKNADLKKIQVVFNKKFHENALIKVKVPLVFHNTDKILSTKVSLDNMQKELNKKIEKANNSTEIGEIIGQEGKLVKKPDHAVAKQDLAILHTEIEKLSERIKNAQVFDKSKLDLNKISFGTKVTLLNLETNQDVVYTILGPFESEPEKNIISYLAPLADEMLDAMVGDELHFDINGTQYNFKVLSIEASELI